MLLYHFCFIFILFPHTGHSNFDFNWCSVLTECCFYPWKSSNGNIHSSSDSYHSIKKYPPAKFLTPSHPPPLNNIWKILLLFLLPCFVACMCDSTTCNVFFYLMIFWIFTCWALVLYYQIDLAVCFMQQSIRFTKVWYIMWFFTSTLIWFDITHTHQKFTLHSSTMSFPFKNYSHVEVICWLNSIKGSSFRET